MCSCSVLISSPAQALAAVLDITADFYGVCVGQTETDERLLALDAAISGLSKPCAGFYAAVGSASAVVREGSLMTD